jgi:hypothetical protein
MGLIYPPAGGAKEGCLPQLLAGVNGSKLKLGIYAGVISRGDERTSFERTGGGKAR